MVTLTMDTVQLLIMIVIQITVSPQGRDLLHDPTQSGDSHEVEG